jgi:opacity protein-like surface antigen
MKKIIIAALISFFTVTSALAADQSKGNLGAGYGFDNGGVLSLHGDFDISAMANKAPVTARVGFDHYSLDYWAGNNYSWSYNMFYGAAYYDFSRDLKLDKKVHPFAGLGLYLGSLSCSGSVCGGVPSPTSSGVYYILGVQYDVAPKIAVEANINQLGGLTIGANFKY